MRKMLERAFTGLDREGARVRGLVIMSGLIDVAGLLWGSLYLALGQPRAAVSPLLYTALSVLSLLWFLRTRRHQLFRFIQLLLILILPFGVHLSLGGFAPSSLVVLWAVMAPIGALMFQERRQALRWFTAYMLLLGAAGALDPLLAPSMSGLPVLGVRAFYVLNAGAFSTVVFLCLAYFVRGCEEAQAQSEELLLNILPEPIVARLKQKPGTIADRFQDVTVLFADIVDFTRLSARTSAEDLVRLLDEVFSSFDALADRHGLEKIKTIGDAYMVVGGLPTPRPDHAAAMAEMALDMMKEISAHRTPTGETLSMRIGINTGPVVAGVIGRRKFIYDLWGDAVNTASRMESHGVAGAIQVTETTRARLDERYELEPRGTIHIKGKGQMATYLLKRRRS